MIQQLIGIGISLIVLVAFFLWAEHYVVQCPTCKRWHWYPDHGGSFCSDECYEKWAKEQDAHF